MKKYLIYILFIIPVIILFLPSNHYDENYIHYNETYEKPEEVIVYVSGEVVKGGTYYFTKGATVKDLIKKCGVTDNTLLKGMNLTDELISCATYEFISSNNNLELNLKSYIPSISGANATSSSNDSDKININEASLELLQTLDGIGAVRAKAIIDYRKKNKFETIDDILKVEGIGADTYAKIKNKITC